jgi:DNA-binding response OmpR family regulator
MISGYGMVRDIALENGADLFLEKPFTKKEFDSAMASLLLTDTQN